MLIIKNNLKYKTWGLSKIITFNNQKIFIKTIPLAKLFFNNQFDTSNIYN